MPPPTVRNESRTEGSFGLNRAVRLDIMAATGLCSPTMNQIYLFNIVPDNDTSGHLETIFNGGLCTNGPVPDHDGLYEVPGQFQHVA